MRSVCLGLALAFVALGVSTARAADPGSFCADCQLGLGVGATYHFWALTRGVVIPATLVFDRDRYELGVFRMATAQSFYDDTFRGRVYGANPFWGFSATRRLHLIYRPRWRAFLGVGGSYKTESDRLLVSRWNFALELGVAISPTPKTAVELVMRHWSDAGLQLPNHGEDFATLVFAF